MAKITVQNTEITVLSYNDKDYISLTDMANGKQSESRAADIIKNWLRNRYTIEFLGTWEMIHNPNFKVVEFDHFRMQAGLPTFVISASEWIEKTNAIGLIVKKGRYRGIPTFKRERAETSFFLKKGCKVVKTPINKGIATFLRLSEVVKGCHSRLLVRLLHAFASCSLGFYYVRNSKQCANRC